MNLSFGPKQHKTITGAITLLAVLVIFYTLFLVAREVIQFIGRYSSVLAPVAVAGVLALTLKPVYSWFMSRLRMGPVGAVCAVYASILIPVGLAVWISGSILIREAAGLLDRLPAITNTVRMRSIDALPALRSTLEKFNLTEKARQAVADVTDNLGSTAQSILAQAFTVGRSAFQSLAVIFNWMVLPIYVAFLLMMEPLGRKQWEGMLPFLKPGTRQDVMMLAEQFVQLIVTFFRGQFVICVAQAILYAIGFSITGLTYGALIGVILGFINIIPYLGSMIGLAIALPTAFLQEGGGWSLVIWVGVVFAVVQMIEGYILTPRIMGKTTGLHPMAIMVALFFWGSAFGGLLGMILAIPLTAFLVVFWRLMKTKYIQEWV